MATDFGRPQEALPTKRPALKLGMSVRYKPLHTLGVIEYVYGGGYAYNVRLYNVRLSTNELKFVYEKDLERLYKFQKGDVVYCNVVTNPFAKGIVSTLHPQVPGEDNRYSLTVGGSTHPGDYIINVYENELQRYILPQQKFKLGEHVHYTMFANTMPTTGAYAQTVGEIVGARFEVRTNKWLYDIRWPDGTWGTTSHFEDNLVLARPVFIIPCKRCKTTAPGMGHIAFANRGQPGGWLCASCWAVEPGPTPVVVIPNPQQENKPVNQNPTTLAAATSNEFFRAASKALVKVARANKTFTTDEIWAEMSAASRAGIEPRTLGGFMIEAQKQGSIRATDRTRPSKRPECHSRPVRVWKSLL